MTVSAAAGGRTAGAWVCAAASLCIVIASAAAGSPKINAIYEPWPLYPTADCLYNYDAIKDEPLRFNVTASCDCQDEYSVLVMDQSYVPVAGGTCMIDSCTAACPLSCTESTGSPAPSVISYRVAAQLNTGQGLDERSVCIHMQDVARVSFDDDQPINVASVDGRAELSISAVGYPQPLSYELSCAGLLPPQPSSTLNLTSTAGHFILSYLRTEVIQCIAVAYTSRKLAHTQPLAVFIHVNVSTTAAGVAAANSSASTTTAPTASQLLPSSASVTTYAAPQVLSTRSDSERGQQDETLLAVITTCVLLTIAVVVAVSVCVVHRRRHSNKVSLPGSADSSIAATPTALLPSGVSGLVPTTIINNSSTNHNYYGNTYEINGPGSSIVIIGNGMGRVSSLYKLRSDDRGTDVLSCSTTRVKHDQEVGTTTCCRPLSPIFPSPSLSDIMACSVELDNGETAVKNSSG